MKPKGIAPSGLRMCNFAMPMSDSLQHECGIAMLRLKKPLQHYVDKYGTPFYGLNKMYLLMEKQHNAAKTARGWRTSSWT